MLSGQESELAGRLREAAASGKTSLVLQLLEDGAPFIVDSDGQTALHQAATAGHVDTVAALVQGGCDVAVQDFTGHTALQRAASEGHVDIVKYLINQGASVDHQDEVHGNTALHEAAWKGFSQTVTVLCRAKANFYIKNRGGFAPLHLCCQSGHNGSCRVLLLNGCKPDIKNNYGDTPLHTSARYGHAGVIRILASAKCNASEQNKNGDTSLHIAAAMGRRKLTKILLESGCDLMSKNKQGETALDISRRKNLVDIIQILLNPPPLLSQEDRVDQAKDSGARGDNAGKGEKKREKTSTSSKENDHEMKPVGNGGKRDKKRSRHSKERTSEAEIMSPYGCHYQPDLEEFPLPRMDTIPDDPLKAGEQYFLDLAGNIKKGPTVKNGCHCGPDFDKFEKKLEKDKRELLKHIDSSHSKLDTKISHLEKKTRDQLFNINQTMKESFASERSECLDRMDRRALRERIAIERQQAVRDISLKRDLAGWLDKKLSEIESRHGDDAADPPLLLSSLARLPNRGRGIVPDIERGSMLRRAVSEELLSDVGTVNGEKITNHQGKVNSVYKGLKVSDHPSEAEGSSRVRRNSTGDDVTIKSHSPVTQSDHHYPVPQSIVSHSTNSESNYQADTSTSDASEAFMSCGQVSDTSRSTECLNQIGSRNGLIRPIPIQHTPYKGSDSNGGINNNIGNQGRPSNCQYPPQSILPIRRFSTEADIHHAAPLVLETASEHVQKLPPYRAPPAPSGPPNPSSNNSSTMSGHATPGHLYHPRDRLNGRSSTLLPPVDEDEYLPIRDETVVSTSNIDVDQDFHRHLLNLGPLGHSDVGSHDSHNDSGYSTRLGASAGPSPSLSGSRAGSTDGDNQYHIQPPAIGPPGSEITNQPQVFCGSGNNNVGPRIRALQNQLKLADINDAKGSLV